MAKGPYEINYENFKTSEVISDPVELLKIELGAKFCKATKNLETNKILKITGLHKADLSRIRAGSVERYSLAKLINLLNLLGYKTKLTIVRTKEAS